MPVSRMNREEFYAKVSGLDAGQLRKILWTLYWRGAVPVRERIEDALNPSAGPKRTAQDLPDPDQVLDEVTEGDQTFETSGVKVIVDPMSLRYLEGAEVDYKEDLMGGGFAIKNPNAASTCGCGHSFSTGGGGGHQH